MLTPEYRIHFNTGQFNYNSRYYSIYDAYHFKYRPFENQRTNDQSKTEQVQFSDTHFIQMTSECQTGFRMKKITFAIWIPEIKFVWMLGVWYSDYGIDESIF